MTKVLHVIIGLNIGGAESMLKRLIESDPAAIPDTVVVSLTSLGKVGESLRAKGVRVHALGLSSFWNLPITFWRLFKLIRQYQPQIVQTWMYHADILGGLAARFAGSSAVVWGIRCTHHIWGCLNLNFWLVRICAICSYIIPHKIICCANSARAVHVELGYAAHKISVIPNGYNFSHFDRHSGSRGKAREELGFGDDEIVIGAVGRFDPQKDFHNFVIAASILSAKRVNLKFLIVGRNNEWSNDVLRGWIDREGLIKRFLLLGEQSDVPYFLSAMDVFCLSSAYGEGFPNVVAEAMAMGLPSVVTRAGDAADILGIDDFVVPIKDPVALADALLRMCDLKPEERRKVGERGARKVRTEYDIRNVRQKYEEVYKEAMSK